MEVKASRDFDSFKIQSSSWTQMILDWLQIKQTNSANMQEK